MTKPIITRQQILDPENYTIWEGLEALPISFNPLGDQWLFEIEVGLTLSKLRREIEDNASFVENECVNAGFDIVD